MGIPGKKASEPATPPAPLTRLEERREDLREKFAEMQWDLGGAAYEMAARDYFRLDVLASMASRLQVVDAELAEIERMARLERAGAAGSCSGCGSLYARGAVYCWRCGRNLSANGGGTVVGPSAAGQIAMHSVPATSPNGTDDAETTNVTPLTEVPPVQEATTEPEVVVEQAPGPPDDPDPEPASNFRPAPGSEGFFARIQARVSSWQLPVRIPVPNRDNLIAMGLMALAFGLMVGVAIGPALGPSSNADATVVAPAPAAVPETPATDETVTEVADTPALGAPAGSDLPDSTGDPGSTTLASTGDDGFTTPTDIPDSPDPVYPDDDYVAPDTTPRAPDETPAGVTGTPLKATVVGVGRSETSYAVVDEFGNLLGLHGKKTPPLASRISNRIEPLANGSFGETVGWTARGEKTEAPLRGVVSYLDPDAGWIVVSSRGASVAVDASELLAAGDLKAELGSQVEGEVGFLFDLEDDPDGGPLLEAISLEAVGDPGTILEINGRLVAADAEAGLITMAPDGGGRIKEKVEIVTPEDFDPATVVAGGTHNATVEVGESGELLLTGLSSDLNAKVADDVTTAFGDHRQD